MNILLRIELIEQSVKMLTNGSTIDTARKSLLKVDRSKNSLIKNNSSVDRLQESYDTNYMAMIERRKSEVASPKRKNHDFVGSHRG